MANLHIRNVPEALHRQLRRCAKRRGKTVREIVLEAVKRELSHDEFIERLSQRRPVDLGESAAELLREAREESGRR